MPNLSEAEKDSSFWQTSATRREALVLGTVGGAIGAGSVALIVTVIQDLGIAQAEREQELEDLPVVADTVKYMWEHNFRPSDDPLYGFRFPSSADVGSLIAQELNRPYLEGTEPTLQIVHEVKTRSWIRSRRQLFGLEQKPHEVTVLDEDKEGNGTIYLPWWFPTQDLTVRALQFYFLGLQRYYEPAKSAKTAFDTVNMPHIGKFKLEAGYTVEYPDLHRAPRNPLYPVYWEAVEKGDRQIWETALRKSFNLK